MMINKRKPLKNKWVGACDWCGKRAALYKQTIEMFAWRSSSGLSRMLCNDCAKKFATMIRDVAAFEKSLNRGRGTHYFATHQDS